jgi:hypothetical protein
VELPGDSGGAGELLFDGAGEIARGPIASELVGRFEQERSGGVVTRDIDGQEGAQKRVDGAGVVSTRRSESVEDRCPQGSWFEVDHERISVPFSIVVLGNLRFAAETQV